MKMQRLLSYVRRACDDYHMIEPGDKIAVGVSGGKDSISLLLALKAMQQFYPIPYELEAVTVSLGLPGFDTTQLAALCGSIDVPFTLIETDIGEIIFDIRKEKNPCSLCAKMRKGAFNTKVKSLNCNKIAYGHNRDDVIETLFLSLFYEGRLFSFSPVSYLDRMQLTSIRPLIYVPEADIKSFIKKEQMPLVKNPCPVDGHTKRQKIKDFVRQNSREYHHFSQKVFGAIQRSDIPGWQTTGGDSFVQKLP